MNIGNSGNVFFLSNPFYRGMIELFILIGTGICGLVFSWKKFSIFPASNILGGIMILLALSTIVHWIVTALKEEALLLQSFPHEYMHYKQKVGWRMIPGIF